MTKHSQKCMHPDAEMLTSNRVNIKLLLRELGSGKVLIRKFFEVLFTDLEGNAM